MAGGDDGSSSLSEIARQQGNLIVPLLVGIQSNPATTQSRVLRFLDNLECLRLPRRPKDQKASAIRVSRERINAFQHCKYVALSYTWTASKSEDETTGLYHVQERVGQVFEPSRVRNSILDRIFNYMRTINVDLLWIDEHGIIQDTDGCKRPTCDHEACIQKREGMEVMDLVYKFSKHPVGLLGRPITSARELKLLANLLQRKLTSGNGAHIRLSRNRNPQEAWMALEILHRITKDDWWHRGWIFQENYKGGTRMKLLIKHSKNLEGLKRSSRNMRSPYGSPIFGKADGELCIRSVDFLEEATRLCLACRKSIVRHHIPSNPGTRKREKVIERILQTAGKYRLVLKPSKPMTPRIVADIEKRQMKERWDRLAITANCCQYSTRLNVRQLMQDNASLSLAMLALCLLNGEVLHNGCPANPRASEMTVSEFLKESLFDEFNSPSNQHSLTFNRSCRFFDVSLTKSGIATRGHLWKIHKIIDTREWPPQGAWVEDLSGMLEPSQRKQLAYFARHLAMAGHTSLSNSIKAYLEHDAGLARIPNSNMPFTERYIGNLQNIHDEVKGRVVANDDAEVKNLAGRGPNDEAHTVPPDTETPKRHLERQLSIPVADSTLTPTTGAETIPAPTTAPQPTAPDNAVGTQPQDFKSRIGCPDGSGGWYTLQAFERWKHWNSTQNQQPQAAPETTPLAVLFQAPAQDQEGLKILTIQSAPLVKAFRDVNKHPPLSSATAKYPVIIETEPFPNLFLHLDDIEQEVKKLGNPSAEVDFEALAYLCRENMGPRWKEAREEKFESGMVSYSTLWTLFKPGGLVVRTDTLSSEWLYVLVDMVEVSEVPGGRKLSPATRSGKWIDFTIWGLAWNEEEKRLERTVVRLEVGSFLGRRKITSLPIYPVEQKGDDVDAFLNRAAERGRTWYSLVTARTSCYMYNSLAFPLSDSGNLRRRRYEDEASRPHKLRVEERVVIDDKAKRAEVALSLALGESSGRDQHCAVTDLDDRPGYLWEELAVLSAADLTNEQAQLCPPALACFGISTRACYFASVSKLAPVEWNQEAMSRLVLDQGKNLLKGLVENHSDHRRRHEGGDIIENKGKGLVILLYGPPGVGKTLTAECVAECIKKPLIALSMGDLIEDESQLERRLLDEFERAINWDAVLLLDEADVVLEARSFEDVRRNSIVSVFLRQLEYYKGVLILTSNRISTMDVAFQSRIQVAVEFEDLKRTGRSQVWKELLESRRASMDADALNEIKKAVDADGADMKDTDALARLSLNGRQIRNVLNVAEGYAFNQFGKPGKLQLSHVREATNAALEFQKRFDEARSQAKSAQSVWAPYQGGNDWD